MRGQLVLLCLLVLSPVCAWAQEKASPFEKLRAHPKLSLLDELVKETVRPSGLTGTELWTLNQFLDPAKAKHLIPTDRFVDLAEAARHKEDKAAVAKLILFATPVYDKEAKKWNHPPEKDIEQRLFEAEDGVYRSAFFGKGAKASPPDYSPSLLKLTNYVLSRTVPTKNGMVEPFPHTLSPDLLQPGKEADLRKALNAAYEQLSRLDAGSDAHQSRMLALTLVVAMLERWDVSLPTLAWDLDNWRRELQYHRKEWPKADPKTAAKKKDGPVHLILPIFLHHSEEFKLLRKLSEQPKLRPHSEEVVKLIPASAKLHRPYGPVVQAVEAIARQPAKAGFVKDVVRELAKAAPKLLDYLNFGYGAEPSFWNGGSPGLPVLEPKAKADAVQGIRDALAGLDLDNPANLTRAHALGALLGSLLGWGPEPPENARKVSGWVGTLTALHKLKSVAVNPPEKEKLSGLRKLAHAVAKTGKADFGKIQQARRETEIFLLEEVGKTGLGSGSSVMGDHDGPSGGPTGGAEARLLAVIASMLDNPVETKNGILEGFPVPLLPKLRHGGNEKQRDEAIDRIYLELSLLDVADAGHRHRQTALVALLAFLERWDLPMSTLVSNIELWRQLGSPEAPKEKEQWAKQDPRFRTFLKFLPHQSQKAKLAQLDALFPKNLKISDEVRLEWVKAITKHPGKFDSVKSLLYNIAQANPFLLNYVGIDPDTAEPYFEEKAMLQTAVAKGAPFPLVEAKDNPVGNWVNTKLMKTALEDLFRPVAFKGKGPRYSFFDKAEGMSLKQFYALWDPFFKEQTGHSIDDHHKGVKGYPPNAVYRVLFRAKLANDLPPPPANPSCGVLGTGASDAVKTAHEECLLYAADLAVRLKEREKYATRLAEAKHLYGPVVHDLNTEINRLTKSGSNPPLLAQLWRTRSTLARLLEPNFSRTADKGKLFENSLWLEFDEFKLKNTHYPGLKLLVLPTQMSDPKTADALVMNVLSKLNPTQVGLQLFVYHNGKDVTPGPLGEKAAYKKAHQKYAYHADPHVRPLTFRTSPLVPPAGDFAYVIMETARGKGKVALYAGYNQKYWDLWTTVYNPGSFRAKATINIFKEVDTKNGTIGWKTEVNEILNEFQGVIQAAFKSGDNKAAFAKVATAIHKLEEVIGPTKGPNSRLPELLEVVRLLPKENLFKWMVFKAAVPDHIYTTPEFIEVLEKMPNDLLAQLHLLDADIPTGQAAQLAYLNNLLDQHRTSQGPAKGAPKTDGPDGPPQEAPKLAKSSLPHPFLRCAETKLKIDPKSLALTKEEAGALGEIPLLYRELLDIITLVNVPGKDPENDCAEVYSESDVREIVAVLRLPTPGNVLSFLSRNDNALAVLGPRLQQFAGKGWPAGKATLQSLITGFSKASAKEKESLRHWAYLQLKEKLAAEDPDTGTVAHLSKLTPEKMEKLASGKAKGWLNFKTKQASEVYLLSLLIGLIDEDGGDGALAQKEHVENEFRKGGLFRFEPHFLVWAMGREYEIAAKHFDPPKAADASPYEGTPKTEQGHLFAFARKELHAVKKGLSSFPRAAYFTGDSGSVEKAKAWLAAWKSAIDGKSPIHQSDTSRQLLVKALQWPEPMRIVQLVSVVDPQLAATIIQTEESSLKGLLADQLKKTGKLDAKGQTNLKLLATGLYGLKPGTPPDVVSKKEAEAEKQIREQLATQLVEDYRDKLIAEYAKKAGGKADLAKIRKQVNGELSDLRNVLFWDEAYLKTQSPDEQKIWGETINRHGAFLAELRRVLGIPSYTEWQHWEKVGEPARFLANAKGSFFSSQGIADALRFLGMETLADHLHKNGPVVSGAPPLAPFDSVQAKNFRTEAETAFGKVLDDAESGILRDLAPKACAYWNDHQEKITTNRNAKLEPTLKGIRKAETDFLTAQFRHGGKAQKAEANYLNLVSRIPHFEQGVKDLKIEYDVKNPDNLPMLKKQVAERQAKAKEARKAADEAHTKWKEGGKTEEDWSRYLAAKSTMEQAEKTAAEYANWHDKLSKDRDAFKEDLPALKKELEVAEQGLVHLKKTAGEAYREYQQAKTLEGEYLTAALSKLEAAKAAHATALKSVMDKSKDIPKDVYKYKYVPKLDTALDEAAKNSKGQFGLFAKTLLAQSLPDEDLKRFSKVDAYSIKLADYCQFLEQLTHLAKVLALYGDYKGHPLYQDFQKKAASGTGAPWAVGKTQFDALVSEGVEKSKAGVNTLNKALARLSKTGLDPFILDIEKITDGSDVWGALDEFSKAVPKSGLSPILGISYDPKHIVQQKVLEKWLLLGSPQRFALNDHVGVIVHALESGPSIEFRPLAEMKDFAQKAVDRLERNLEAYMDGLPAWLKAYNTTAAIWMFTRPDHKDAALHKLRTEILSDIEYLKNVGDIPVKITINAKGETEEEKYAKKSASDAAYFLEVRLDSLLRATDTTLAQIAEDIQSQITQAYVEGGVTVATLGLGKGLGTIGGKLFTAGGKATNIFAKGGLYALGAGVKGLGFGLNYAKLHLLQQVYRGTINPLIFGDSATPYRYSQDEANLYWGMVEFWLAGGAGAWLQNLHVLQHLGRYGSITANFVSFSSVGFARGVIIDGSNWKQALVQGVSKGILMSPFDDFAAAVFNNPFMAGLAYQGANAAGDVLVAWTGITFRKAAHQEELDRLNALPEEIRKLDRVKGLIDYHKGELTKLDDVGYVTSQYLQEVVEGQILAGSVGLPNALKGAAIGRFHRALADVAAGRRSFDDVVRELAGPRWYHHLLPQGLRPGVNESVVAEALSEVGPKTLKDLVAKGNDPATQAAVKAEIDAALDAVARQHNVDPGTLRQLIANEPTTWVLNLKKNVNPWNATLYIENLVTNRLEELKTVVANPAATPQALKDAYEELVRINTVSGYTDVPPAFAVPAPGVARDPVQQAVFDQAVRHHMLHPQYFDQFLTAYRPQVGESWDDVLRAYAMSQTPTGLQAMIASGRLPNTFGYPGIP